MIARAQGFGLVLLVLVAGTAGHAQDPEAPADPADGCTVAVCAQIAAQAARDAQAALEAMEERLQRLEQPEPRAVQIFASGHDDCQGGKNAEGQYVTTTCTARCGLPDMVLVSGSCGITGAGEGLTGYIQNFGINTSGTSDRADDVWYCTWQPINGVAPQLGYAQALAYCEAVAPAGD